MISAVRNAAYRLRLPWEVFPPPRLLRPLCRRPPTANRGTAPSHRRRLETRLNTGVSLPPVNRLSSVRRDRTRLPDHRDTPCTRRSRIRHLRRPVRRFHRRLLHIKRHRRRDMPRFRHRSNRRHHRLPNLRDRRVRNRTDRPRLRPRSNPCRRHTDNRLLLRHQGIRLRCTGSRSRPRSRLPNPLRRETRHRRDSLLGHRRSNLLFPRSRPRRNTRHLSTPHRSIRCRHSSRLRRRRRRAFQTMSARSRHPTRRLHPFRRHRLRPDRCRRTPHRAVPSHSIPDRYPRHSRTPFLPMRYRHSRPPRHPHRVRHRKHLPVLRLHRRRGSRFHLPPRCPVRTSSGRM